jgi:hypothetical protein
VDNLRKKPFVTNDRAVTENVERRRISRIVHDDRGNASVEWCYAPSDHQRDVLELETEPAAPLSIQTTPSTFNPYERGTLPESRKATAPRKDLRKLSEWIKMMRELEERKRKGEVG